MKTYAVGDVHGMFYMLEHALGWIREDAQDQDATVVFLGDYVDRGPRSAEVVTRLMEGPDDPAHRWVCLKGNHEDLLIKAVDSPSVGSLESYNWLNNGGSTTLDSYGGTLPPEHIDWIRNLPLCYDDRRRVFVHAGIDPALPLYEQAPATMMWTRPTLEEELYADLGRCVVHGHTPLASLLPMYHPGRVLNIDTAACFGGCLTVAAWDNDAEHPRIWQRVLDGDRSRAWSEEVKKFVPAKWLEQVPAA